MLSMHWLLHIDRSACHTATLPHPHYYVGDHNTLKSHQQSHTFNPFYACLLGCYPVCHIHTSWTRHLQIGPPIQLQQIWYLMGWNCVYNYLHHVALKFDLVITFAWDVLLSTHLRNVVRKKRVYVGKIPKGGPPGGEGSDPNPLHIFLCFFSNVGAYKMAKKRWKMWKFPNWGEGGEGVRQLGIFPT